MTYTIQHNRRHEIEFYEPPTSEQWTEAVKEILGPDCAYICISVSDDRTIYVVEEVDIQQAASGRSLRLSGNTKVVPTTVVCAFCKSQFEVLFIDFAHTQVSGDVTKKQYRHFTKHCPNCPPMSIDVWLAYLGYYIKPPIAEPSTQVETEPPALPTVDNSAIDMTDFV